MSYRATGERGATGSVGDRQQVVRADDELVVDSTRHVVIQADSIHPLSKSGTQQRTRWRPGYCQNRDPVELCIIKPIEQVHCSRTCRADADAQLAGKLRITTGHESSSLFVPN